MLLVGAGGEDGHLREGAAQVLVRIYGDVVDADFVVEVRTGAAAAQADVAEHVAASNRLAGCDGETGQVAVACADAVRVLHDDDASVAAHDVGEGDNAVRRRQHGAAVAGGDVHAAVEGAFTAERVYALAERAGNAAVHRPERGRGRGALPVGGGGVAG